jgi:hypothetical protein
MKYKIAIVVILVGASVFSGIYMTGDEETRLKVNIIEKDAPKEIKLVKKLEKNAPKEIELVKKLKKQSTTQPPKKRSRPVVRENANNGFVEAYKDEYLNDPKAEAVLDQVKMKNKPLFKRLNLSKEDEQEFAEILTQKEMLKKISLRGLADTDKEELNDQKKSLMNDINEDIADLLGDDQEQYEVFEGLEKEYNQLLNAEESIESVGGIDEFTQDELAQYMNVSYKPFNEYHNGWEKAISESQENAENFLSEIKELNDEIINNAPVKDYQKAVLEKIYEEQYNHLKSRIDEKYTDNAPADEKEEEEEEVFEEIKEEEEVFEEVK